MHCRSLELSITLATHFSAKKVPIHPKPFSFHVQNSLYSAIPLTTPTDCCLNLVSCTTQMPSELHSNISTISPDLPLRVLTLTMQTHKSRNSFSWWCSPWMIVWLRWNLTIALPCMASSVWNVPIPLHNSVYQYFL